MSDRKGALLISCAKYVFLEFPVSHASSCQLLPALLSLEKANLLLLGTCGPYREQVAVLEKCCGLNATVAVDALCPRGLLALVTLKRLQRILLAKQILLSAQMLRWSLSARVLSAGRARVGLSADAVILRSAGSWVQKGKGGKKSKQRTWSLKGKQESWLSYYQLPSMEQ